ncbi:ABC transporter ATP-binding protein [Puniceicoccus vermicola]|uniref:ABC transporter ATP-binding protein n=1 Tax=Puniceicoccus vermicola TaxID=388746 RepID=A0A7X1AYP4_9BACT|nr:ABC transporter ATP-binding protein [Puniceicoccus vermicola]MBC2602426.1 ABC transporter ATP-binding protein [Puniceicoccus vermicola]
MSEEFKLPSYREQSPKVAERFRKMYSRPVKMEIKGLSKTFQTSKGTTTALKGIDFSIYHREFVSVIGPSGCGKSTLIRMLAGLDFPTGGEALLEGKPVTGPGSDRGMVFQGYTLFPWLTVKKNVMFGLELSGKSGSAVESEARSWINIVGLSGFEDSYPSQLSGGMKQRVAIARALANNPRILFMDEPFGALDAQTRSQMQAYLLQIWKNVDVTIMFVTHDLDEAIYLSDRILVLKANPGEVNEVIEVPVPRPRTPEQFISPEFLATRKRLEELIHPKGAQEEKELPVVRMVGAEDEVE